MGRKIKANKVNLQEIENSVTSDKMIMIGDLKSTSSVPITENSTSIKSLVIREITSPLRSLV